MPGSTEDEDERLRRSVQALATGCHFSTATATAQDEELGPGQPPPAWVLAVPTDQLPPEDLSVTHQGLLQRHEESPVVVDLAQVKKWSTTGQFYKKFPQLKLLERMREVLEIKETDIPRGGFQTEYVVNDDINQRVSLWAGDITTLKVGAIVNSAHPGLTGGGGVDGYIHSRAGDELFSECQGLGGCFKGEAKITKGYRLPAQSVIHTVGPTDQDGDVLERCYWNSLDLAYQHGLRSIAFPCIATGNYGFSAVKATQIALNTTRRWLEQSPEHRTSMDRVVFCTFTVKDEAIYETLMPCYFPVA